MKSNLEHIEDTIRYLRSIQFPRNDWKEDRVFFDQLEARFSEVPSDAAALKMWKEPKALLAEKRADSLNRNNTSEVLFAGWQDE